MQIIRNAEEIAVKESIAARDFDVVWGQEQEKYADRKYGIAVDIGTTTVALSVYQLQKRRLAGSLQERNRQCLMGSDVIMRLMHCQQGKQEQLRQMVVGQLEDMAAKICEEICSLEEIQKMTVVGNTAMCHIFAGKDTAGLAGSPFRPDYQGAFCCKGSDVGFREMGHMDIYILPGIDAHVGADATAMITELQLFDRDKMQLAVDIGTNAEIALNCQGKITVCSAPAGPAFEGMEISCGMRGIPGAIARVKLAPQTGNIVLDVIGQNQKPKGICGSGLIDAVAQLLQCGMIQPDGYLLTEQEARQRGIPETFVKRLEKDRFVLYVGEDRKISLTREDIRQFQLAKAAVQSGIKVLLSSQGICLEELDEIWIAGMFGGHISKSNAVKTGLFPDVSPDKLKMAGNAAGRGAALALLSSRFCRQAEQIARQAQHLELASNEVFRQEFLKAMELR